MDDKTAREVHRIAGLEISNLEKALRIANAVRGYYGAVKIMADHLGRYSVVPIRPKEC